MPDEFDDHPTLEEVEEVNRKLHASDKVVQFHQQPKKDEPQDKRELALNKHYATVLKNSKLKVIDETRPEDILFLDKKDFMDKLSYRKVLIELISPDKTIKAKWESETKLWLENQDHRQYDRVIFDPHPNKKHSIIGGGDYNLWRGFAIQPRRGKCYKTLQYIKKILCNNDKKIFRWLMAWTSHIFQRPWEKPETAVCLHGEEEGTGKSFFPMIISKLMDGKNPSGATRLYFKASNSRMLTGDFTGHLERCILLHAEEAFRAESEREDSIIKDLISGEDMGSNPKGVEAHINRSYIRLILTGNPPHIVKASRWARRFLVSNVSSSRRMDLEYFRSIQHELDNGGYEALMYYLMHYPINKFSLREAPKTEALLEQKLESLKSEERFWYNMMHEAELPIEGTNQGKYYPGNQMEYMVIKYILFNRFQRFTNRRVEKNRADSTSFGMRFSQFFPVIDGDGNIVKERNGKNMRFLKTDKPNDVNFYIIPTLSLCRRMFEAYIGHKIEWPDNKDWTEKYLGSD
jgi:hypothetical protein